MITIALLPLSMTNQIISVFTKYTKCCSDVFQSVSSIILYMNTQILFNLYNTV